MKRGLSGTVSNFLMVSSINLIGSSVLERLFRKSKAFLSSWYPASIVNDTALCSLSLTAVDASVVLYQRSDLVMSVSVFFAFPAV